MFQNAIRLVQKFTYPVIVSYRSENGNTDCSIGTFIVLNKDGWILTAYHILNLISNLNRDLVSHGEYTRQISTIDKDPNLTKSQRTRKKDSIKKPQKSITNFSVWWGRDDWRVNSYLFNPAADLAIGKIVGFNHKDISEYPQFKNPSINFDVGENLCKFGAALHKIVPEYDKENNAFRLPSGSVPVPFFPMDGMFTRTLIQNNEDSSVKFLETSTPGLPGHSGGPTFDFKGRIWALQSRTIHHSLGFSPNVPNNSQTEHQFLNCGLGTHVETIAEFLQKKNCKFSLSED